MSKLQAISIYLFSLLLALPCWGQVSQIAIPRIEQMPNEPSPFNVRDWKEVAIKYDAFVYDLDKSGQYLPLISLKNRGTNYPENPAFQLDTYVGTNRTNSNEAINVLPSLVGASLVGIDKSNQNGYNWVLMSQDFFNKNNGQRLYLNNVSGGSGNDWWYDMMPNIFFYQLYDLYPEIEGEADLQFVSIADRFSEAVRAMGGQDSPWTKAFMNYRAWDFATMTPNPDGVKQPEAAGAYAWVLYHAFKQTDNPEYLKAAEWSMEFLSEWDQNPSYELQLPYGTYVAAKMNAELGTNYDIEKMVNWSFDRGHLRGWGTIVGTWNGFDVSGLVGEANDNGNDYAFQLNGVQQAAMLVPMTRYDKRFARAIGKWILNLANATRLFYPGYLPGFLQDASEWSDVYDPDRVVGYEALREKWEGKSPFSTGDALRGGWANTNLALYGTSSIGYLGGIIEQTNVEKILMIDLLKTDFYREQAYPTWLFYNPYSTAKTVQLEVGENGVDLYEALSETFIQTNVSGQIEWSIPPDAAMMIVQTPAGGQLSYDQNRMLVDGVVVDYMQTAQAYTFPPRIKALAAQQEEIELGKSLQIFATVFDRDSENINYSWGLDGGTIEGEGQGEVINWSAPDIEGEYAIELIASDESDNRDTATLLLRVVPEINLGPQILEISKEAGFVAPGKPIQVSVDAFDPNDDPLTYTWSADGGSFSGSGNTVTWLAPAIEGIYKLQIQVEDDQNVSTTASTMILVKEFPLVEGRIIADYPFLGNADDQSGNDFHGIVYGAKLTTDRKGEASQAYYFDGTNDVIGVANDPKLNVQEAITVSLWFSAADLFDKETFLVSHGSWQNRWKISIIPEKKIRWTINSTDLIGDLDSDIQLEEDKFYHVTATYDGEIMALYINGNLHSFRKMTGTIRQTPYDLLIGQMLPGMPEYNFHGTIDEVKIFDYALVPDEAKRLYAGISSAKDFERQEPITRLMPNPVKDQLTIQLTEMLSSPAAIEIYSIQGQKVVTKKIGKGTQKVQVDTRKLTEGIYLVVLNSGNSSRAYRFVKQ